MSVQSRCVVDATRRAIAALAIVAPMWLAFPVEPANAQPPSIMTAGDAIVTGFSGVAAPVPPFPSNDPIDETFIDLNGASMRIQRFQPNAPPQGQVIPAPTVFAAPASAVGQVFAITMDDLQAPNIYLGASSVYGLQIVIPDNDGDGRPERVKTGQPDAQWMQGQWGPGGSPGSIWRVDSATGAITLFTTIGANAGPGLGDVVYDRASHQYFVSDLDTGLIYRLDWTGLITDTFDHGTTGRPNMGLPAVADDGNFMDITSPAFDSENPATWGYTQPERMVWGLAMYAGRLYYAVAGAAPQIWSVGINLDGTFGSPLGARRRLPGRQQPGFRHPLRQSRTHDRGTARRPTGQLRLHGVRRAAAVVRTALPARDSRRSDHPRHLGAGA